MSTIEKIIAIRKASIELSLARANMESAAKLLPDNHCLKAQLQALLANETGWQAQASNLVSLYRSHPELD